MTITYLSREHLATDIWHFRFRPSEPLHYVPGQYVHVELPAAVPAAGRQRAMTLISHPSDDTIGFVTRLPTPCSSFKTALTQLRPGDEITIDEPMGDLVLPLARDIPIVFIAGGIGVASYISMLQQCRAEGLRRSVSLLYAVRSSEDRVFSELLTSFPFAQYKQYTPPQRLSAADILAAGSGEAMWYLSGTEAFVESLRRELERAGVGHTRLVFDYFSGY